MPDSSWTPIKVFAFLFLALLRGTTPLMAYFAVSNLDSSGLVVAWKSAISFVFFVIMLMTLYNTDGELKLQISDNFKSKSTYWKLPLIGLLQAAAPYLLVVYSLKYLPPTLLSVFMTATPWFTIILERLPFVKIKSTINSYVKIGMCVGLPAVLLIMSPILHESLVNCSMSESNSQTNVTKAHKKYPFVYDICLDKVELLQGTLALVFGSLLWAISSVFWRSQRGDIHYTVSSLGQNLTACIVALVCWPIFDIDDPSKTASWFEWRTVIGLAFLGIGTGWFATVLVHYLSKEIGPKPTNQVLVLLPIIAFIEDCVIVKSVVTVHPWLIGLEILGILMLSVAAFLTNLPGGKATYSHSILSEQLLQSEHQSEHDGNFRSMQDEIEKYRKLTAVSEDDSSAKEEELPVQSEVSVSYPPLREIVGDDLSKTATFGRK